MYQSDSEQQQGAREASPALAGTLALTWLGHATALIEQDGVRLLTDPLLRSRVGPLVRIAAPAQLPRAGELDAVLLSHLHADHADPGSLRELPREVMVIAPPGARAWLARQAMHNVVELAPGQSTSVGDVEVRAVSAVHDGRRSPRGARAAAVGFAVLGSQGCYFAGDTDLFTEMRELAGSIDLALLPVSGWGPTLGPGHLDPERAARAASLIQPRVAVPIHWGTIALPSAARRLGPRDPWEAPRLFARVTAERAPAVEVRLLAPGESTELAPGERA